MTGAKRHSQYLEIQKTLYPKGPQLELAHSSATRWSSRSLEVEKFLRRFDVILDTLAFFQDDQVTETKLSALSLLKVIQTKKFVAFLVFFARLYNFTDVVTRGLQKQQINVESVITLLDSIMDQTANFDVTKVINYALELCEKFNITEFDTRPSSRARMLPTKLKGTVVMTSVGNSSPQTVEDLHIQLRQVVAHIRGELRARFGRSQFDVMRAAAICTTSSENFMDADTLQLLEPIFGISVTDSEIEIFRNFILRRTSIQNCHFGLAEIFEQCDKDVFPSVHSVLQLLLTIPQTSVTVERLFSSVKRIKTRLRSLMTSERLSSLCLLSFEKELLRTIDRERILTHFKNSKNRRLL